MIVVVRSKAPPFPRRRKYTFFNLKIKMKKVWWFPTIAARRIALGWYSVP
jgi:hypothetical protein